MPRLNRTTTQFGVPVGNGVRLWTAEFEHRHEREVRGGKPGKQLVVAGKHGQMRVKHITRCTLRSSGSDKAYHGYSRTSIKDEYRWMDGIRIAFQRALAAMELCIELTDRVTCRWSDACGRGDFAHCSDAAACENPKHYRGGHNSTLPVFKALKPEYKYFMQGFFTEMRHRDGPTAQRAASAASAVVDGEIVSVPRAEHDVSASRREHGMGHVEDAPQALSLVYQGPLSGGGLTCY